MSKWNDINISDFDFIDFGSSKGGSINFAKVNLGGINGLGIDVNKNKVIEARNLGFECIQADATNLDIPDNSFDFSIMSHFLEHLPSESIAERAVHSAIRISRKFVFIRGPWYDSDEYLKSLGLKFYWSDWHGHPNHIGQKMLKKIILNAGPYEYKIWGVNLVKHSKEKWIHPFDAPKDKHAYIEEYGIKRSIYFTEQIFREIFCVIKISEWPNYIKKYLRKTYFNI